MGFHLTEITNLFDQKNRFHHFITLNIARVYNLSYKSKYMAIIGDALRQAFMPKHEYQNLRDEEIAWIKLQKPIFIVVFTIIILLILTSNAITLRTMFPSDPQSRPFCKRVSIETTTVNEDQEIVDYYWLVVFVPSVILFFLSAIYLVEGV